MALELLKLFGAPFEGKKDAFVALAKATELLENHRTGLIQEATLLALHQALHSVEADEMAAPLAFVQTLFPMYVTIHGDHSYRSSLFRGLIGFSPVFFFFPLFLSFPFVFFFLFFSFNFPPFQLYDSFLFVPSSLVFVFRLFGPCS